MIRLTLFVQVNNDVGDIVSMVADLSVSCGLHPDEGCVIELGDETEDLSLATARAPMDEYVTRAHAVAEVTCLHAAHAVLVSDGLGDDLLGFLLRNDMLVEGLNQL
jgi:hypothetical protein